MLYSNLILEIGSCAMVHNVAVSEASSDCLDTKKEARRGKRGRPVCWLVEFWERNIKIGMYWITISSGGIPVGG